MTQRCWQVALCFLLAGCTGLMSCAKALDMSAERLDRPGTEWGVVIGSVLVQPHKSLTGGAPAHETSDDSYEFDIVQIQPGDPNGENPYAERYRLTAKPGEERLFVSRLRSGQYLFRNFHKSGVMGIGGELNLTFASMAGEIRYVGRVLVDIPQRASKGKGFHFVVENAREATLAQIATSHPDLTRGVVDAPLQARPDDIP